MTSLWGAVGSLWGTVVTVGRCRPDLVDMEALRRCNAHYNLQSAFNVAERELGLTKLLDPEGEGSGGGRGGPMGSQGGLWGGLWGGFWGGDEGVWGVQGGGYGGGYGGDGGVWGLHGGSWGGFWGVWKFREVPEGVWEDSGGLEVVLGGLGRFCEVCGFGGGSSGGFGEVWGSLGVILGDSEGVLWGLGVQGGPEAVRGRPWGGLVGSGRAWEGSGGALGVQGRMWGVLRGSWGFWRGSGMSWRIQGVPGGS